MKGGSGRALREIDLEWIAVVCGDVVQRVQVRRSANARRYTLRVRAATRDVMLTMPLRGSLQRARQFAERQAGWIGARLQRLPVLTPFGPGAIVPVRGVPHVIAHRPEARGLVWTEAAADGQSGQASLPHLCVAGGEPFVARRIRDYLIREARADLCVAVHRHATALGVSPTRITLRDTASRWGSCSSKGALNFSWRLIMAPPHVLDYLAAHEVAHLRHMNHSAAFWQTCAVLLPDYRQAEAWLKAHGLELLRFGPSA